MGTMFLSPPGVFKSAVITEFSRGVPSTCVDEKGQTLRGASMEAVLWSPSINEACRAFMNRAFESPASKAY